MYMAYARTPPSAPIWCILPFECTLVHLPGLEKSFCYGLDGLNLDEEPARRHKNAVFGPFVTFFVPDLVEHRTC